MSHRPNHTHERILDATLDLVGRVGVARTALEDVASAAGVSRQTVYRHFGNRDGLLAAVIVREEELLLDAVTRSADGIQDVEEAVATGLEAALRAAQDHPILTRLLETEPEALLPFLTLGTGPVLSIIGPAVAEVVVARTDALEPDELEFLGDAVGRVVVSYVISPRQDVRDTARRLARVVSSFIDDARRRRAQGGTA